MTEPKLTQENLDAFNAELTPLLKKHGFGLGAEATIVDGKIMTKVVITMAKPVAEATPPKVEPKPEPPQSVGEQTGTADPSTPPTAQTEDSSVDTKNGPEEAKKE